MIYINENSYILTYGNIEGDYVQLDENTDLGRLYLVNYPHVKIEQKNGVITDVIVLEKPEEKPNIPQKTPMDLLQERITQLEVLQVNTMSLQIENKLLGGNI